MSTKYKKLISYVKKTEALSHASSLIAWDQETMMPNGAVEQRADCLASIESEIHNRKSNVKVGELLDSIKISSLNKEEKSNYFHIKKSYLRSSKIPNDLATEIAKICSLSQMSWVHSKKTNDTKRFLKYFKEVINLKKKEAKILSNSNNVYDALLNDFEPEMTSKKLDKVFQTILKAATYEFLYKPNISINIIIKEYLNSSNFFLEDSQTKYLNALLDNVGKKLRISNA